MNRRSYLDPVVLTDAESEALFHTLFDWWRGDCGMMHEGEDMPNAEEQAKALEIVSILPKKDEDSAIARMIANRWFFSEGLNPDEFKTWLQSIIYDRE